METFEGERDFYIQYFISNTFIYFKPLKRCKNRSGVSEFWSFDDCTSKGVLDLLETICLGLWKIVVQRVAVVKSGMDDGGCNDTGCFVMKIMCDTFVAEVKAQQEYSIRRSYV